MSLDRRRFTGGKAANAVGFALPFLLLIVLSFRGGGYDAVVRAETGIVVWALVGAAALAGWISPASLRPRARLVLALLGGLAAWTALSLVWTNSTDRTFQELTRAIVYLGVGCLAFALARSADPRRLLEGIAAAIAVIGVVALLSRLHSPWFPVDELAAFDAGGRGRLNYPLNYWNGLATLLAVGLPLLLWIALEGRRIAYRALAAGVLPAVALAMYFTFSRTGLATAIIALAIFLGLVVRNMAVVPVLGLIAAGSALAIGIASGQAALVASATGTGAISQGETMIFVTAAICVAVAGLRVLGARRGDPDFGPDIVIPRRPTLIAVGVVAIGLVVAALAAGAPSRIADQWEQFKAQAPPVTSGGSSRFVEASGNGRYQYWSATVDAVRSEPLTGTGAGTFEFWWAREGEPAGTFVKDAHSLYFETASELGIPGLLLVIALVGSVLVIGATTTRAATGEARTVAAAGLAAASVFAVAAMTDWIWEMPVVPIAFLCVAAALVSLRRTGEGTSPVTSPALGSRLAAIGGAAVAIAVIVIALAGEVLLRDSQEASREGDLAGALDSARTAADINPFGAGATLQEALVLQNSGRLDDAAVAAREAADAEEANWRNWYVLFDIEQDRGATQTAQAAVDTARSLNPGSALIPAEETYTAPEPAAPVDPKDLPIQAAAARASLQEAVELGARGQLDAASEAARRGTREDRTNWRIWHTLYRIESARGAVESADYAYRKARALNPNLPGSPA